MLKLYFKNCCKLYSSRRFLTRSNFKNFATSVELTTNLYNESSSTKIDEATALYLESVSLVGFESEKTVKIVEDAINFADQIFEVNTVNVEPLVTVLENEYVYTIFVMNLRIFKTFTFKIKILVFLFKSK